MLPDVTASTTAFTSSAKHTKHRAKQGCASLLTLLFPHTHDRCDHTRTCIEVVSTAFAVDNHDEIVLNDYEDLGLPIGR